jgi:hypothetical protein
MTEWRPTVRTKKEVPLQNELCKAIGLFGGKAQTLNNRFIHGVPDLLIKLLGYPGMLIECKRNLYTHTTRTTPVIVPLEELQFTTLKEWHSAGMPCGLLSFLLPDKAKLVRGKPKLPAKFVLLSFYEVSALREPHVTSRGRETFRYRVDWDKYTPYESMTNICRALQGFAEHYKDVAGHAKN